MKLILFLFASLLLTISSSVLAVDGLIVAKSPYSTAVTMERVEAFAKLRGLTVFARIDHAAGAAKIGKTLRPTQLIIFEDPQGELPLWNAPQTVGIDLPLKVLAGLVEYTTAP